MWSSSAEKELGMSGGGGCSAGNGAGSRVIGMEVGGVGMAMDWSNCSAAGDGGSGAGEGGSGAGESGSGAGEGGSGAGEYSCQLSRYWQDSHDMCTSVPCPAISNDCPDYLYIRTSIPTEQDTLSYTLMSQRVCVRMS